jgi:hypothetical protein
MLWPANPALASDGSWGVRPPPPRTNHSIIYDPVRERLVLFAGFDGTQRNDVWVLSLVGSSAWARLAVSGSSPPPRERHAAIYDPVRDRMVIFGGRVSGQFSYMSDVWELSFAGTPTWSQILPGGTAVPLYSTGAIYDPVGDRMVIFGGQQNSAGNLTRELTFSGTPTWNDLAPSGTLPPIRREHVVAYDPALGRMLVFGGISGSSTRRNDAWELSLGGSPAWNQISPSGTPPSPRNASGGMFDSARNRLVVFGGFTASVGRSNEVWSLDFSGSPSWTQLLPGGTLPDGRTGWAVYDAPRDRMLHYGGVAANELWALSFSGSPVWAQIAPWGPTPSERYWFAEAYDQPRGRLVVFGGKSVNDVIGDLWTLDLAPDGQWTPLVAAGTPPGARYVASMIYDPVRERAILFGGLANEDMNDVWALSLNGSPAWTQLNPAGAPPPARDNHPAIYDPVRDRMIVFGGSGPGNNLADTWALSLPGTPTWSQILPSGTPPALARHAAIYDAVGDRMIVFGGLDNSFNPTNGVWALSLGASPAWTALTPAGTPPPLNESQAAVYDSPFMRMLANVGNGIYELTLGEAPAWRQLDLDGDPMVGTFGQAMVLDPIAQRITITGAVASQSGLGMPVRFVDLESSVTGVQEAQARSDLAIAGIAPNPSHGPIEVTLSLPRSGPARIEVLDLAGRRVAAHALDGGATGVQRARLRLPESAPPGLYMICLRQRGRVVSRPLVLR